MQTSLPMVSPEGPPGLAAGVALGTGPMRCCLLTVWSTGEAGFAARVVLMDGTLQDFTSPFELARFLSLPLTARSASTPVKPGLR